MGNWVFLAGATSGVELNGKRRFYAYNTGTTDVVTGDALDLGYTSDGISSLAEYSGFLYFAPVPEPTAPASNWWYSLQSVALDNISYIDPARKQSTSGDYRIRNLVLYNGSLYGVLHETTSAGATVIVKINADGTYINLYTVGYSGRPMLLVANGKLNLFFATATNVNWITSTNGATWGAATNVLGSISAYVSCIAALSSTYGAIVTLGSPTGGFTSNGGVSWTVLTNIPAQKICVANASGVFLASDTTIYKTTDSGANWTNLGMPLGGATINQIVYGNSEYMIIGSTGLVATTTDFITFTPFTGVDFTLHDVYVAMYTTSAVTAGSGSGASGVIQGTLRLDNSLGAFAAREVYLYNYTTGAKVAETLSDASTGVWQFTAVAPGDYFVVGTALKAEADTRDFDALGVITVA